ncbi:MAG: cysteine dioxygenase family protein [Nocardiopsaceae bacterium]|nr:cysteine dioxygenase family protein [Nocardiopsaceae bacterium]
MSEPAVLSGPVDLSLGGIGFAGTGSVGTGSGGWAKEVVGGCPRSLTESLAGAVRARGSWQQVADRVADVLRANPPDPGILTPEQRAGDPSGYQTHLLHAEPDGSFSVTVMVWLPGQETPIHDHLAWCVTAVMEGAEQEEIYAVDGGRLRVVARNANPVGAVSAFAPPGDIHLVRNAGTSVAISMHVYGTDISRVGSSVRRVYDPRLIRA